MNFIRIELKLEISGVVEVLNFSMFQSPKTGGSLIYMSVSFIISFVDQFSWVIAVMKGNASTAQHTCLQSNAIIISSNLNFIYWITVLDFHTLKVWSEHMYKLLGFEVILGMSILCETM